MVHRATQRNAPVSEICVEDYAKETIATKFCGKQAQGSSVRAFQGQFLIKITDLYLDFLVCDPFLLFSS